MTALFQAVATRPALSQQASSCTSPPSTAAASYLLPPWSDSAGWKNPDQYETIVSGDIDGDGVGELVGRNGAALETWTWDRSYGTTNPDGSSNKAYDPLPGQWIQILPKAKPAIDFSTDSGWWDPSRYWTFQLSDVDPERKGDELIVRWTTGLWILTWDSTNEIWAPLVTDTGVFDDNDGFGQSHPDTYTTITTGNVDGQPGAEIIGRGPGGIQAWTLDPARTALTRLDGNSTLFTDADFWNGEDNYATIRVADVYGDSREEVLGRATDGLQVWSLDVATETWTKVGPTLLDWGDGQGWDNPKYYETISVGQLDERYPAVVLGRTEAGIDARYLRQNADAPPTWQPLAAPGGFTDQAGFGAPDAYETMQIANFGAPEEGSPTIGEVIARNGNGLYRSYFDGEAWVLDEIGIGLFSDANGWGSFTPPPSDPSDVPADFRYSTIEPVTIEVGKPQAVIGRANTGIQTTPLPSDAASSLSSPFPPYTDLTGISNGLNTPPAELPGTPEGRVYWYINAKAHAAFWPGAGDNSTILEQYRATSEQTNLGSLNTILAGGGFAPHGNFPELETPGEAYALNVPRATYNDVNKDVNDWTTAVTTLYGHLLGGEGVKQLIEQSFVTNVNQVDIIKAAFEGDPALDALLGDLLAVVIALAGTLDFGLSDAAEAILAGAASLAGAGVSGGFGFLNPDGNIDSTANTLNDDMVNSFCGASAFVDQSFDQAVQDYGLLTTSARMVERSTSSAPTFDQSSAAMVRGQQLWIWQQFGNQTFQAGWCDFEHWDTCRWSNGDAFTWNPPENPSISYRLIVGHCTDSPLALDAYAKFQELNPSVAAMMSPRQTDVPYDGSDSDTGPGTPPTGLNDGFMGTQGWNLGVEECDS